MKNEKHGICLEGILTLNWTENGERRTWTGKNMIVNNGLQNIANYVLYHAYGEASPERMQEITKFALSEDGAEVTPEDITLTGTAGVNYLIKEFNTGANAVDYSSKNFNADNSLLIEFNIHIGNNEFTGKTLRSMCLLLDDETIFSRRLTPKIAIDGSASLSGVWGIYVSRI